MKPAAFSDDERRLLLRTPGIGATVVDRLEAAGFCTLHALREAGAACVAERVQVQVGHSAWKNRRRAIERAIEAAARCHATTPSHTVWS